MKILKEGRKQRGWAKEYVCTGAGNGEGGCGATLLVEQADVFQTHHYDYGGGHDVYNTFRCASCKVLTDIKGSLPFTPRKNESDPIPLLPGEADVAESRPGTNPANLFTVAERSERYSND